MTKPLIQEAGIQIGVTASSREEAVTLCGELLVQLGAVSPEYVPSMWQRELVISSFVGRDVAIPHGTDEARQYVSFAQVVMLRLAQPIDWDGEEVSICFGIAAKGGEHGDILGNLADILLDDEGYEILKTSSSTSELLELLSKESE